MLLLGPGKNSHKPKIALAKLLFYVPSNKIDSLWNRNSQILVIVLKNCTNEICSNEIHSNGIPIRQGLPVCIWNIKAKNVVTIQGIYPSKGIFL